MSVKGRGGLTEEGGSTMTTGKKNHAGAWYDELRQRAQEKKNV